MSFGLRDEDWVDPDDETVECMKCEFWEPCPCDCGYGWCSEKDEFTERDDECG